MKEQAVGVRDRHEAQEAFVWLMRAQDRKLADLVEVLRPAGLSPSQFNVLRILRGAGDEGLTCRGVGERLIARVPDVTRLLDRLEAAGHVRRLRAPAADRRRVLVRISPKGRRALARLDEPVRRLHEKQFSTLRAAELKHLVALLARLA